MDSNKRLQMLLHRMQARFRGIIVRAKIKNGNFFEGLLNNMKFIPRDPYGSHKTVKANKIVSKFN